MNESRLIASTMTVRFDPLEQALGKIAEAGFSRAELCSVGDWVPHFDVPHADDRSVARTAEIIRASGVKVECLNIGGVFAPERMEFAYALAKECGAGVVTHSVAFPQEGRERAAVLAEHTAYNAKIADIAEKYGVVCAVEAPHKLSLVETAAQAEEYWKMQDPRVRITFDCAHFTFSGEDPAACARLFAGRAAHVHLRDAVRGDSLKRYGEGAVDFPLLAAAFREGGYKGYFSMEYPPDNAGESTERLRVSAGFFKRLGAF